MAGIGATANDESYARLAQMISMHGYTDVEKVNEECYVHLGPSQIKSVTIQFSKQ